MNMTIILDLTIVLSPFKLNILETGSVSFISCNGGKFPIQLGPLDRVSLCHWTPKEVLSTEYILFTPDLISRKDKEKIFTVQVMNETRTA
jgi:hypothetical protein